MWQGAAPGVLQASFGGGTLNLTAPGLDEVARRMDIRREPGPRRLRPCFHAQRLSIIVPSMEHQKHHRLFHHQTFRGRGSSRSCQAPRRGARSAAAGRTAAPTKSPLEVLDPRTTVPPTASPVRAPFPRGAHAMQRDGPKAARVILF